MRRVNADRSPSARVRKGGCDRVALSVARYPGVFTPKTGTFEGCHNAERNRRNPCDRREKTRGIEKRRRYRGSVYPDACMLICCLLLSLLFCQRGTVRGEGKFAGYGEIGGEKRRVALSTRYAASLIIGRVLSDFIPSL